MAHARAPASLSNLGPGFDVLDGGRLAGGLVDRVHHDVVLAAERIRVCG